MKIKTNNQFYPRERDMHHQIRFSVQENNRFSIGIEKRSIVSIIEHGWPTTTIVDLCWTNKYRAEKKEKTMTLIDCESVFYPSLWIEQK